MSHIHELQFVEKGGVQCSTLGCHVYYSEEHIIKILERLANENASQQGVQLTGLHCPECGVLSFAGRSCNQCGFPYLRPATNA